MRTRARSKIAMRIAAVLAIGGMVLFVSSFAAAQGGLMGTVSRALSSFSGEASGGTFSIARIEPDVQNSRISIHFTDSIQQRTLANSVKFIPPVAVQSANSSSDGRAFTAVIQGGFRPGQQYAVVLPPNFKSANGRNYVRSVAGFTMPDLNPDIAFFEQGSIIERNSRQMLHVQLRNVNEVQYKGLRIPPVLIWESARLEQEKSSRSWDDLRETLMRSAARLNGILEKESEFRPLAGLPYEEEQLFFNQQEKNVFHQFSVPLSFRREREKGGIALVQVSGKNAGMPVQTPRKLYRITDLGMTYKLSDDALILWTTSLYSGRPAGGAALFAITAAGDAAFLGRTGPKGLFRMIDGSEVKHLSLVSGAATRGVLKRLQIGSITTVIAILPDDVTYLNINPRGTVSVENIEQVRGGSQGERIVRKGHVFTERGIYRPGDIVHFKATVREFKNGTIAVPAPPVNIRVRIRNSKNEEVYDKELALSDFGTASGSIPVKQYYPLGTYTIQVEMPQAAAGVKSEPAHRTFEVQEFRQPRHFVEIAYKRESRKDDSYVNLDMNTETLKCEIGGKYYAGGPVKHGKVRWSIYHTRSDYPRQDFPGYSFGHPLDARTDLIESGESMLDEKGMISVAVPLGADVLSGKYGIEVTASVIDFDGRASTESSVYQGDPAYLVGISSHPPTVKPGENQTLSAIVIDRKGSRVGRGSVVVQVMERGYTYIQKRNAEGSLYHEQQQIWRSQLSAELPLKDDRAVFDFDFTRGGDYLIAFTYRDADGREYVSATRYSMPGYYYDYGGMQRDQAKNYGKLNLYPEKPLYTPGETIKLYVNPPKGVSTFLVTVEQGGVIELDTFELRPDQRFIEVPAREAFNPNVYISLLGTVPRSSFPVHAGEFDDEAPSFVFGTVNVEVKGAQQKIHIAVNEEQKKIKSLPGGQMTLHLAATDQDGKGILSEMAVAVVDESILSMTGFETPSLDLLGKFLLPLGVFTGDLRLDLLRQTPYGFFRNTPLTGGDGEAAGPEAVSSKVRKDFNPVAYFNPAVRTDANGRASVTFTFPDTMTTYRVYAVACDRGSRFGSYQRPALVVKDFYLEPGLPAFLTRGDRFRFAVSSFNRTEAKGSVGFDARSDDLLSLTAAGSAFRIDGFDRALIPVEGVAQRAGTTTMRFDGTFRGLADSVELKLPVNSGHVLGSDTIFGSFRRTARVNYALPQAVKELRWSEVAPGEVQCTLTVSSSPFLRMAPGLRYFLRYPYG